MRNKKAAPERKWHRCEKCGRQIRWEPVRCFDCGKKGKKR